METVHLSIILLSFLSVISTVIGIGCAYLCKKSTKKIIVGIGFSAGIMLIISFLELLPKSIKAGNFLNSAIGIFAGIVLMLSLNIIFPHTHFFKEKGKLSWQLKTAYLVALGLILHDIPEGFALANSYILAPSLGILVAISIALHNIPEEFAMAVPLIINKDKKALIKLGAVSALAEPAGAVLGILAVSIAPALNPFFMAFAAGAMIFISLHELFPMARKYKKTSYFLIGFLLSIGVYFLLSLFLKG
jgi:ZIP family zinc transporter